MKWLKNVVDHLLKFPLKISILGSNIHKVRPHPNLNTGKSPRELLLKICRLVVCTFLPISSRTTLTHIIMNLPIIGMPYRCKIRTNLKKCPNLTQISSHKAVKCPKTCTIKICRISKIICTFSNIPINKFILWEQI